MDSPTVGSLFTGIGGFDLGLERAGWRVRWQVENNPFRQKILKRHWPDVELRGDIITDTDGLERVDLICGGFPCQDLSVAGRREGLAGKRSALFFEFARILNTLRPRWCLIENVPGLLSSNDGRDFAVVLSTLGDIGYWWTYRVLDSQYWGVAQRRRRVYVVGHLGGPCPPEILLEPESVRRHLETRRKTGTEVARTLRKSADNFGGSLGTAALIPEVARPLVSGGNDRHDESQSNYIVNARQTPIVGKQPLDTAGHSLAVAVRTAHTTQNGLGVNQDGTAYTLDGAEGQAVVSPAPDADRVRAPAIVSGRLDTPDGPRYAALGDAVTVNVAEWIGRRILSAHRNVVE